MKKRLLCLALCMVMLLACLAGCSEKTEEEAINQTAEKASESAKTLAMYMMVEKPVSVEQEAAIENAVNNITKARFKTKIDLKFYTPDEYYAKLDEAFAKRAEAVANGTAGQVQAAPAESGDETTTDETVQNEWGFFEIKYPEIADYQVDIFYLGGYDNYVKYNTMGMMQNLDSEISSASKQLNSYLSSSFLKYMKSVNDGVMAIPTNTAIGEYTYLLLNKEVLKQYGYDTEAGKLMFANPTDADLQKYLKDIYDNSKDTYVPFYSDLSNTELASLGHGEGDASSVGYLGVNGGYYSNDFSVIGGNYVALAPLGNQASYMADLGNIWNNEVFKYNLNTILDYRVNGYFGTADDLANGKAAVACVKGGANIAALYEENYEAVVIGKPVMQTMDLYDNMFAVSSYSSSLSRSMEIVTYLNTNDDFRNILLYGLDSVTELLPQEIDPSAAPSQELVKIEPNYELVESEYLDEDGRPIKVVKRLNEEYMVDPAKIGNMLIGHCLEGDEADTPVMREFVRQQNVESGVSYMMGFKYDYKDFKLDTARIEALAVLNEQVKKVIDEYVPTAPEAPEDPNAPVVPYADLDEAVRALLDTEESMDIIAAMTSIEEPRGDNPVGIGYVYQVWATDTKIYVEEVLPV